MKMLSKYPNNLEIIYGKKPELKCDSAMGKAFRIED
jgi:hypothetical protein